MIGKIGNQRFYLEYNNKYGDNWITYKVFKKGYDIRAIEDFHCDRIEELHAYMQVEISALPQINWKTAKAVLMRAIAIYGVGKKESIRRNNIWHGR